MSGARAIARCAMALALAGGSAGGYAADTVRGKLLYENHCQVCHTGKVHGRPDRWPGTRDQLRGIVDQWQKSENLRWRDTDVDDVAVYLNERYYRFEK